MWYLLPPKKKTPTKFTFFSFIQKEISTTGKQAVFCASKSYPWQLIKLSRSPSCC